MFLPTFLVAGFNVESGKYDLYMNDEKMWEITFVLSYNFKETKVPVISCVDLISSWTHLPEEEREMLIGEVPH